DRRPGSRRYPFAEDKKGDERCDQWSAGLNQEDICDRRMGQGDDECGRADRKAACNCKSRQTHVPEQRRSTANAIAPEHEADEKDRSPERAPENYRPGIAYLDETRDHSAKAPAERSDKNQNKAEPLVLSNHRCRRTGCIAHRARSGCMIVSECC